MSEETPQTTDAAHGGESSSSNLDAGTYEVLHNRLTEQATQLTKRAEALNAERIATFGGTEMSLLGTTRIRTTHNCVPRDIVHVGDRMLFGYNVHMGLKTSTSVSDVFTLHTFNRDGENFEFTHVEDEGHLLDDRRFINDFEEMYRYYRQTELLQVRRIDNRLLAVFQTGDTIDDQRVLRWNIDADGTAEYLDNYGERDQTWPDTYDFEWVQTGREDHVTGRHPHVSIDDELFVECVGGDLTIKVEDNTDSGEGIYSEQVEEKLQSLADADIAWARVGALLLLKILPYNEKTTRYFVYNTITGDIRRADNIGAACRTLPEDHGIIFPGGYYLAEGELKTFDTPTDGLRFKRLIRSPNGEDFLYVFYSRHEGRTLLLPYNVIRKEVSAPLSCHGFALFDDGSMAAFRSDAGEATRVHPMQVWQTPFVSDTFAASQEVGDGPLERVGNSDLVRAISDALSVARMIRADEGANAGGSKHAQAVFETMISAATRALDDFPWLADEGLGQLDQSLKAVRATAEQVLDEYATVAELSANARTALAQTEKDTVTLLRRARGEAPKSATAWVEQLTELRRAQGHLVTLRDTRYIDVERVEQLQTDVTEGLESAARRAIAFLRRDDAFTPYFTEVEALSSRADQIDSVAESKPITEELAEHQHGLETLTEVVSDLDIGDATVRTGILSQIGEVLASVNRTRAGLQARRRELASAEGRAEFAAEYGLLGQAITAALAAADTPATCDEQLGRLMLTVENLETRFADFDDFLTQLDEKRSDIYEAFSSRKQNLLDEAARRAENLAGSADRILEAVSRRVSNLSSLDEVNTYFATDPMVDRLRRVAGELRDLDDVVRAEEIEGRIAAARQEAGRALQDQLDLYDGDSIRFGEYALPVNSQPLDLTLVPQGEALAFSLTGTDFRQRVDDEEFNATAEFWAQTLPSENATVYRAEHLAASLLTERGARSLLAEENLNHIVSEAASQRYDEGYERGVHDTDAALILEQLIHLYAAAGMLRYRAGERAAVRLWWAFDLPAEEAAAFATQAKSLGRVRELFGRTDALAQLQATLGRRFATWADQVRLPIDVDADLAGEYLAEELAADDEGFATSARATDLVAAFHRHIGSASRTALADDLQAIQGDLSSQWTLAEVWLQSFLSQHADKEDFDEQDLPEAIALLLTDENGYDIASDLTGEVTGLLGTHPRISDRTVAIRLDEFLARTGHFRRHTVPGFRRYHELRGQLVAKQRRALRVEEYHPRVMSGFVRNQLIDEVYLPLIGSNLTKQIGGAGDSRRTDQSGMLMLISPPGYGKTTLMEYVAARLGMLLVKINGPSLGYDTVSVDPDDAPNATARQEVEKINFALECGNNVLLYLDDIQHTNAELLQKFISLCDGQRRMEGVWQGRTRTYDLRGKRFAVCMAGNPYTEAGQRFRIPDMLANRADTWNLGDVLSGREEVFALSYIENSLTSNPVLAPLAGRDRNDVRLLVRLAQADPTANPEQLSHPYSAGELDQITSVLRKLLHIQKTVLAVNQAYISSAATDDSARVEPPFLLQGSYRNMGRLAERVVPVMNDEELEAVIDDHYVGEAQSLAAGAEANLLKLAQLRGRLTEEQAARWADVKQSYLRNAALGGSDDDPMARAVGALGLLTDRVADIASSLDGRRDSSLGSEATASAAVARALPQVGSGE
ncbi:DNA repair ATPase [Natronoglycomyces albus]|uniref:DNA repair ATPase n=1 Tax=Natronoglycomyces albus TaxID=2811108 RepID=A0A895XP99_9ACTN|nr:DNA repair ATPase [Natronoglycomyces albus]QSB05209.1 DNA repair ATPase [Natronoglycomyces albus]